MYGDIYLLEEFPVFLGRIIRITFYLKFFYNKKIFFFFNNFSIIFFNIPIFKIVNE